MKEITLNRTSIKDFNLCFDGLKQYRRYFKNKDIINLSEIVGFVDNDHISYVLKKNDVEPEYFEYLIKIGYNITTTNMSKMLSISFVDKKNIECLKILHKYGFDLKFKDNLLLFISENQVKNGEKISEYLRSL